MYSGLGSKRKGQELKIIGGSGWQSIPKEGNPQGRRFFYNYI